MTYPDFNFNQGEHWLILGQSGCGKTTLLHLLGAILKTQKGQIEINDVTDGADVEATGGYIGCNKQANLSLAYVSQGTIAGALGHVAMESRGTVALFFEIFGQAVGIALGGRENNGLAQFLVFNQMVEQTLFVAEVVGDVQALFDV